MIPGLFNFTPGTRDDSITDNRINVQTFNSRDRYEANKKIAKELANRGAVNPFFDQSSYVPISELLKWCEYPISGFCISNNQLMASLVGPPLRVLAAKVVALIDKKWSDPLLTRTIQPFKHGINVDTKEPVAFVPFRGNFYLDDLPLDQEFLENLGIHILKTLDVSDEVLIPAYQIGGRGLLFPGKISIPVHKTSHGGYRVHTSDDSSPPTEFLSGIAVQYCGVGSDYQFNVRQLDASGSYEPDDGEIELKINGGCQNVRFTRIVRTSYANKEGIFLDQQHESYADAPTGGTSIQATKKDLRLDALLWEHGALMAGVKLATINLLDKVVLDNAILKESDMPCDGLSISIRIYFEDTHRLSALTSFSSKDTIEHGKCYFRNLIERDYGEYSQKNIAAYLSKTAGNIGKNIRICFNLGITLKQDQESADNLGLYGGILDTENFFEMTNRYQVRPLLSLWLQDIVDLHSLAGLSEEEFFQSESFHVFIRELFPDNKQIETYAMRFLVENPNSLSVPIIASVLASYWVQQRLIDENLVLDQLDLLEIYFESSTLQRMLMVPLTALSKFNEMEFEKFQERLFLSYLNHMIILHEPQFGGGLTPGIEELRFCQERITQTS